jgi:hypothetical protein
MREGSKATTASSFLLPKPASALRLPISPSSHIAFTSCDFQARALALRPRLFLLKAGYGRGLKKVEKVY